MGILDRFKVSEEEKKRRADKRKREFEARKAAMEKKQREVREGRAAGLSMTEIRAKRMNISAAELKKRQLATVLGMAEGMSIFLPAGAAIKAGQLVYKGLKGAKAAKALKAAAKANRASKGGKQSGRVTVSDKQKSSGGSRRPKKDDVIEGTAVEKSSKPAKPPATTSRTTKPTPKPKPKDKKPGTAVATRPRTAVKKPGTGVMEVRRGATSPRTMKRVQGSDKPTPKPSVRGPAKPKTPRKLTPAQKALLGGAALTGGAVALNELNKATKPKPAAAADTPRSSGPATRGSRKPPSKKAAPKVDKSAAAAKRMPTPKKPTKEGAAAKRMPKRTSITAGANTGFGPKGNIFPKNAEDRKRLMRLYGGTGSAAAKAAAAGTQGNLKKKKSS